MTHPLLILGAGNMGSALARRWHAAGIPVQVVARNATRADALAREGIATVSSLEAVTCPVDGVVLAIKPQQLAEIADAVRAVDNQGPLISLLAGVPSARLQPLGPRVVRAMPNLPSQIGEGVTGLYATDASPALQVRITKLFDLVGRTVWVEKEDALHAITGISGSGSGYVFAFMEALLKAAMQQGFSYEEARLLVAQTFKGAALMAADSDDGFGLLAARVASPGGTTQAALHSFENQGLTRIVQDAVSACVARSKALAH